MKPRPPRLPADLPPQLHGAGGIARDLKEVAWGREYRCPGSWGGGGWCVPREYLRDEEGGDIRCVTSPHSSSANLPELPPKLGYISPTFLAHTQVPSLPRALFLPRDSLVQRVFSFAEKISPFF